MSTIALPNTSTLKEDFFQGMLQVSDEFKGIIQPNLLLAYEFVSFITSIEGCTARVKDVTCPGAVCSAENGESKYVIRVAYHGKDILGLLMHVSQDEKESEPSLSFSVYDGNTYHAKDTDLVNTPQQNCYKYRSLGVILATRILEAHTQQVQQEARQQARAAQPLYRRLLGLNPR